MATQQPWDQDNPTGTLYCPPGEGCASWQPFPEAFPAPCKVSWRLFLLHLSPHPWSSLPAAPGNGVRVLKVPSPSSCWNGAVQQWHWDVLAGPELSLLQLSGGDVPSFFSLASELMPTHPDVGRLGQPGTCPVPFSKACPRSSSPQCLRPALSWHLVPLWREGSVVSSSPPASAARGSKELRGTHLWDLLGFLIDSPYLGSISLVCRRLMWPS